MAHQALINTISARWEFSVGAWKRAQGLDRLPMLHELTAEHLNEYMQDKAAENLALYDDTSRLPVCRAFSHADLPVCGSSATATTDLALFSTGLCPGCEQPGQEPDYVTERLEVMNAWDLREYMFALDDLKDNLVPALRCSLQCFAASFLTNAVHLYFWPLPQHKVVGFALTALTVYHAGFALTYRWFLCLIARCRSHTEQLKHKVDGVLRQRVAAGGYRGGDADDLCEDDVRAWCGWKFKVVSHVAWERDLRSSFYETGLTWRSFLEGSMSWLTL